eukprot:766813-Hanusia_phi.AAC.2
MSDDGHTLQEGYQGGWSGWGSKVGRSRGKSSKGRPRPWKRSQATHAEGEEVRASEEGEEEGGESKRKHRRRTGRVRCIAVNVRTKSN